MSQTNRQPARPELVRAYRQCLKRVASMPPCALRSTAMESLVARFARIPDLVMAAPFADLDVNAQIPDPEDSDKMIDTGLDASKRVSPGDVWGCNLSHCVSNHLTVDGMLLPTWQWHDNSSFAPWPHHAEG